MLSAFAPEISAAPADTAAIFKQLAPYIWRVLRSLGVPESEVADVCQEVFVVVHKKLGSFEQRSSLRTWVYGIAVYTASDHRKRMRRRRETLTDTPPEQIAPHTPDSVAERREAKRVLSDILDELDDDKRAVFVLYEIEQLSMAEVAGSLGCPLQTAYSRLHAARTFVQQRIAQVQREVSQ